MVMWYGRVPTFVQDFASQVVAEQFYTCASDGEERPARVDSIICQNGRAYADITVLVDAGYFFVEFPVLRNGLTTRVPLQNVLLPIHVVPLCDRRCAPPENTLPAGAVTFFGLNCKHRTTGSFVMNPYFIK